MMAGGERKVAEKDKEEEGEVEKYLKFIKMRSRKKLGCRVNVGKYWGIKSNPSASDATLH